MNKIISNSVVLIVVFLGLLGSLFGANSNDIENVYVTFCNEGDNLKKLEFGEVDSDLELEICINIENRGNDDLPLIMNFVDGVMTSDGKHIACKDEEVVKDKNSFSKFVSFDSEFSDGFILSSESKINKKVILKYPKHFSGDSFGCLTYYIGERSETEGALNVLVRKANVISATVSGKLDINVKFSKTKADKKFEKIVKSKGKGNLIVKQNKETDEVYSELLIENKGNVKMEINFVSDIFSKDGSFNSVNGTLFLLPGESKLISSGKVVPTFSNGDFEFNTTISYRVASDLDSEMTFFEFSEKVKISKLNTVIIAGGVSALTLAGVLFFLFP